MTSLPCDFDQFGPEGFNVLQESLHRLSGAYDGLEERDTKARLREEEMQTKTRFITNRGVE